MSWIPGPLQVRSAAQALSRINRAGGPRRLRLIRVGRPHGRLIPSTQVSVEVETLSGEVVRFDPELPVPFFYAWGYRLARRLGLPVASTLDPEDLSFELPVPGWAWPGGRGDLEEKRRQRQT
jgi:hypothetical protein